ncbi:hypothetical protein Dimus_018600 [Dionaea muscipula]
MAAISSISPFAAAGLGPSKRRDLRKRPYTAAVNSGAANRDTRSSTSAGTTLRSAPSTVRAAPSVSGAANGRMERKHDSTKAAAEDVQRSKRTVDQLQGEDEVSGSVMDYFRLAAVMMKSDGGPPRWFTPLECGGSRLNNSPLLLYLPGIDGTGLGLLRQHRRLGKIFDVWCLHIPATDRTSFADLVILVERTIRSEHNTSTRRPIYLVGESLGGCLALAVAARNPNIDLVLILANPATSFNRSQLRLLMPVVEFMPSEQSIGLPNLLSLVAAGILSKDSLMWKLGMLNLACGYANARLHAVKAQTLILSSGRDALLPSHEEGERLHRLLPQCENRKFKDNGHFLFLDDGVDLVYTIKGTHFYRRGRYHDYATDFLLPTPSEFKRTYEPYRWIDATTCPVMLSTLADGKIVRGLAGIPREGPVLFVGYHMLLGLDIYPLMAQFFKENIIVRGLAHPLMFKKIREGLMPDLSSYDSFRLMGAVPVTGFNLFKLLSSKSHVLLFPGGMREALHRKGEEYKLFWPDKSEFVRVAARFGAKIIPFGTVGEDDIGEVIFDYDDLMRIPYFKSQIEEITSEVTKLRTTSTDDVGNQDIHLPVITPKLPGRMYYLFGTPIETEGRREELKDRQKAHELYLQVQYEVERCLDYLKERRETDPYRNILTRTLYQARHDFTQDVPTFEL